MRNCLFHVQVAVFQSADTVKNYSQVLFRHFIREQEGLEKLSVKRLIRNEVARGQSASSRKRLFYISSFI